ncbi:MAG TPA: 50S ribosomal protein L20 [Clostridia bacterium]|nr:50S ribosomal protein L20 [Clostridia bacterium]
MRVKTGYARKRAHKKVLKQTKGYRMTKRRLVKVAKEALLHAGVYAYTGRKDKKSNLRQLWITRISGALSETDLSYSQFIKALKEKNIELDRKILAQLIQEDPEAFQKIVEEVKK